MLVTATAFALLTIPGTNFWFAFACVAGAACVNSFLPSFWAIPYAFLGESAAAASTGLINSIGNLGGFVAPFAVGYFLDRTHSFAPGFLYTIAGLLVSIFLVLKLPGRSNAAGAELRSP